ncbi:AEC family transporter [Alkalibacter saccharofermentans]|uniref:Membrane transport protein n=1 Tax=Alkalibacter saccharofermentans DSM 14828 TaxID=1120975 RepID=A0A1M4TFU5_9FIRM|nr:AEC family transporter [Alkalibacter saccharofermentans]SHE43316.1 hypothetical protein SAMN02746064_00479 [Alkalibacter saccharofermentans DSM 14828]
MKLDFYNVFVSITTLFAIGAIGYHIRKKGLLSEGAAGNFPKFITDITLPCLIISSMQLTYTRDRIQEMGALMVIAVVAFLVQLVFSLFIPFILGLGEDGDKGVYQFMIMFQNAGFIGYPVLVTIFGLEAVFYGAIYNIPFRILIMTLGVSMMENEKRVFSIKDMFTPGIIATLVGLALFFTQYKLPVIIDDPINMIGSLTTPLAMIYIGASMTEVKFGRMVANKRIYMISFIRLLAIPMVILLAISGFVENEMIRGVPVVIHAMPVATLCTIFAKEYNNNVDLASSGVFMTTLLSMVTIPLIVTALLMV